MYAIRIINNKLSIEKTGEFFADKGVDVRPFFYPINSHEYLKDIINDDDASYILNNEIIMLPSYPDLSFDKQEYVVSAVEKFVAK
jgi:dTDP-4-amino-4,6-dideoxygalactose transaminase